MTTNLRIQAARNRYEGHKRAHLCAGCPCPQRVKLWRDYRSIAAQRDPTPAELSVSRLAYQLPPCAR